MARNFKRLEFELKVLQDVFGHHNVVYPEDCSWVKIRNFGLPAGKYNLDFATVLILIPEHYDIVQIETCCIDKDLALADSYGKLTKLPHSYAFVSDPAYKFLAKEGYQWICFEATKGNPKGVGVLDFVNTLKTYLTDPLKYSEL